MLGAIDDARNLTELGKELARLPVDPRIGTIMLQVPHAGKGRAGVTEL